MSLFCTFSISPPKVCPVFTEQFELEKWVGGGLMLDGSLTIDLILQLISCANSFFSFAPMTKYLPC